MDGWVPFKELDEKDKDNVRRLLNHNPTCPEEFREVIYKRSENEDSN